MQKPLRKHPRGSIFIWSVMLGVMLSSAFFFFGTRLHENAARQEAVMVRQSREAYLQSYAAYLQSLPAATLLTLTDVDFDGITGTLTREAGAVTGFVESGGSSPAYAASSQVTIEWNRCEWNESGDLLIEEETPPAPKYHVASCAPGQAYDEIATFVPAGSLTLRSASAPFHYRITSASGEIQDEAWHLSLSIPLPFLKNISLNQTFTR